MNQAMIVQQVLSDGGLLQHERNLSRVIVAEHWQVIRMCLNGRLSVQEVRGRAWLLATSDREGASAVKDHAT